MLLSDFRFRKPKVITDGPTNGGRVSKYFAESGALDNLFATAFYDELEAGSTRFRKLFLDNDNATEVMVAAFAYLWGPVTGDDWIMIGAGTQRDTEADMAVTRWYGSGDLDSDVVTGADTIVVKLKDNEMKSGTYQAIKAGDEIIISDKPTFGSAGNIEKHVVLSATPDGVDPKLTLVLDGTTLANDYLAADTIVMPKYEYGDIEPSYSNFAVVSSAGDYDDTAYPIYVTNQGTTEVTVTGTFVSATVVNFVDDEGYDWGTWDTTTGDFVAVNPDNLITAWTIYKDGLSGTFAINDTISFQTHPADAPIWFRRKIPALCSNLTGDGVRLMFSAQGV